MDRGDGNPGVKGGGKWELGVREVGVGGMGSGRKVVGNRDVMKWEHVDIGRDIF